MLLKQQKGIRMKLNSINAYKQSSKTKSNQNFGMAKLDSIETLKGISDITGINKAAKIVNAITNAGAKNSIVTAEYLPDSPHSKHLFLRFPKFDTYKYDLGEISALPNDQFQKNVIKGQQTLLNEIMGDYAITGKLDKAKKRLLNELSELSDDINDRYVSFQNINDAAKRLPENTKSIFQRIGELLDDWDI